jgi:hypothetical protein
LSKSRDYEALCREIGPQQGWPYEDLINRHKEQQDWERVLAWAEDGLGKLLAESGCRLSLQEARGEALIDLGRSAEALDELQALFQKQRREAPVCLKLRQAAQAVGQWEALYLQLTAEMQAHVLSTNWQQGCLPSTRAFRHSRTNCARRLKGQDALPGRRTDLLVNTCEGKERNRWKPQLTGRNGHHLTIRVRWTAQP